MEKAAGVKAGTKKAGEGSGEERPLTPAQCRSYMRRVLAREFRGIVQGFVDGAKSGSCQHVKLATELVTPPARARRRTKGTAQMLLEKLEREEARAREMAQGGL